MTTISIFKAWKKKDFLFLTSKNRLKVAKAAGLLASEAAYWDVFDAIQYALFVDNRDVCDLAVIEDILREAGMNVKEWKAQFFKAETEDAVLEDLQRVRDYGFQVAPAIVINQKYLISGAQPQAVIEQTIEKIGLRRRLSITRGIDVGRAREACCIVDSHWICDEYMN